jgi:hypothetical protein
MAEAAGDDSREKKMSRLSKRFYRADSMKDLAFLDHGELARVQNHWVFEAAWEVANKGAV